MQKDYIEVINYLYSLQRFGIKLGLHNIKKLLKFLQNPEKKFISIHIAGTNGKGSTSSFIASILSANGYKVGLYTSPHLVDFTERIKINGIPISRKRVVEYVKILNDQIEALKPTFFETTTAIAFKYFADENVDFAVIETGLGGRLDSTNVIQPAVSIITNISYDHMDVLGESIEQIAFEKAGIIKSKSPCITGCNDEKALNVIRMIAKQRESELIVADEVSEIKINEANEGSVKLSLRTPKEVYNDLIVGMPGKFQSKNVQLAVLAFEKLSELGLMEYKKRSVYEALSKVREFSGLRGRLEILNLKDLSGHNETPKVILDVAHNYPAIRQIISELGNFKYENLFVLFGVMKDKEYEKMIAELSKVTNFAVGTQPKIGRALAAKIIADIFQKNGVESVYITDSDKAFDFILSKAKKEDAILIIGSHYLAGEIIAYVEGRKIERLI